MSDIRIEGLKRIRREHVANEIRLKVGEPYRQKTVDADVTRITHLGRFAPVKVEIEPQDDGAVVVVYKVNEKPMITDIGFAGNKKLTDQELTAAITVRPGDAADEWLINRAVEQIKRAYAEDGYHQATVLVDRERLEDAGLLIFRVREGPFIRIRKIEFDGNVAFSDDELRSKLRSKEAVFIIRKGDMSMDNLDEDLARLRQYYIDRGYIEVEVGREIKISPNQKDAVVIFTVAEGPQYIVDDIVIEGNAVFSDDHLLDAMAMKVGDVYSSRKRNNATKAITNLYGTLGYIETQVVIERRWREREPNVLVIVRIDEGRAYRVGKVTVRGNQNTQERVILHRVRGMTPGRRFDRAGVEYTALRLRESSLFNDARISVLGDVGDLYRDVLIEVDEASTGRVGFGVGVSSDAGVVGAITLSQSNFDIFDPPETVGELFTGKAFRGAGQSFSLAIEPGNEQNRFGVSFSEPHLLESDIFFSMSFTLFQRVREDWDEGRIGGSIRVGRRFGDVWSGSIQVRIEQVDISDLEVDAPLDAFAVAGESLLGEVSFIVSRNTTDSRIFPTRGSRIVMSIGYTGGDFNFTRIDASFHKFWTVDEDFLGRKSVFSMRVQTGLLIPEDEAPLFERFYAGGHRTFRGFDFRGVGPRGLVDTDGAGPMPPFVGDDPVGGDFMFLVGFEYNFPILEDYLRMVVFTDMGTVEDDIEITAWRVSIGTGFRLQVPLFGPSPPIALDFAYPIIKEDADETRFFSFDLAIPF